MLFMFLLIGSAINTTVRIASREPPMTELFFQQPLVPSMSVKKPALMVAADRVTEFVPLL